jgi:hypothetical protein
VNPSDKVGDYENHDSHLRLEAVLFDYVLEEFPTPVTLFECAVQLRRDPNSRHQAEEVDLISRQLVQAGLLHRTALGDSEANGYAFPRGNHLIQPTKAALHGRALNAERA